MMILLSISSAILIGGIAHRRGRNPILWALLTLIPFGILVTWPLLYILPRHNDAKAIADFLAKADGGSP